MKKVLLIDGNSLFYRCYYATFKQMDYFIKNNLFPTNAISLFNSMVIKLIKQGNYNNVFIAFDHSRKSFRTNEFEDYKSNRKSTPIELIDQLKETKFLLENLGICFLSMENYEADDLIGSMAKKCKDEAQVQIYTSDRDFLQLVDKNIDVNLFVKGISEVDTFTIENFPSKMNGLIPHQVIDLKAISGDSSDNYKGIKGIGPKTAINLLIKYKTLDGIYDNIDKVKQKDLFMAHKDDAILFKKIATIKQDIFDNDDINITINKTNWGNVNHFLEKYNLKKLSKIIKENW